MLTEEESGAAVGPTGNAPPMSPATPDSSVSLMWDADRGLIAGVGERSGTMRKGASWSGSPGMSFLDVQASPRSSSRRDPKHEMVDVGYQAIDIHIGVSDDPFCYSVSLSRYPHITGGYRPAPSSVRECVASIFQLHNETVNIWTHVVGTMIFAALLGNLLATSAILGGQTLSDSDVPVMGLYLLSGVICFVLSAVYHTLTSASDGVAKMAQNFDHMGILCLMMGSNFPMIYFGFFNNPGFILLHTAASIGAIAIAVVALQLRKNNLFVFLALALLGWVQLAHDLYLRGALGSPESNAAVGVWVKSFGVYAVGVAFYASKAPECFLPGCFDLFFSSHQIWHVAVVAGALVHLHGCLEYARLARVPGAA